MAQELTNMILKFAESPKELEAFSTNPEQYIDKVGLSADEKNILLSLDAIKIRDAIASELNSGTLAATEWVIVLVNVQTKSLEMNTRVKADFSQFMKSNQG